MVLTKQQKEQQLRDAGLWEQYKAGRPEQYSTTSTEAGGPTTIKPGELPPGAVRDASGKIYYPGGLESIQAGIAGVAGKIPGIQAGIKELSATDLTEGAGAVQPVTPTTTIATNAGVAITSAMGTQEMYNAFQTQHEKERQEDIQREKDTQGMWAKFLDKRKSSSELLAEQQAKVEESPAYKKVQEIAALSEPLNLQIADLTNKETAEIDRASQMGMSEGWLSRKETEIHNKYNKLKAPIATQLNAYAANAMLYEGQLDRAYKYMYAAVDAAVYDQEFAYTTINDFMDRNDAFLNSLRESDRFYFTNALALSKEAYDTAVADAKDVGKLMLQYPGAGINITDTWQQATQKASAWSGVQVEEGAWAKGTPTSYKEWKLAGSPGTFEEWKKREGGTTEQYKAGLLSDKTGGMSYEDAVRDYGAKVNLDYIDRVYKKGKYFLQEQKIAEIEEGIADEAQTKKDIPIWDAKLKNREVHRWEEEKKYKDGIYIRYNYTEPSFWKSVKSEKVLWWYEKKQ